jgi:hypothetical protein
VFEYESIKFTCSVLHLGTSYRWSNTPTVWSKIEFYSNKTYQIFTGFPSEDKHLYAFYCFRNGSFTLEIISIKVRQNDQDGQCGSTFETSNKVTIHVKKFFSN